MRRGRGQAPPPRMYLSVVYISFVVAEGMAFSLFSFVRRIMGRRRLGTPHYNCANWFGVGSWVYLEKLATAPYGQRHSRCHGPSGRM